MNTILGPIGKTQNVPPPRYGVSVYAHFDAIDMNPDSWGAMNQTNVAFQPSRGIVQGDESSVRFLGGTKYCWTDETWLASDFELWYVVRLDSGRKPGTQMLLGNSSFSISVLSTGVIRVQYGTGTYDSTYPVIHAGVSPWLVIRVRVNKTTNRLHFEMNRIEIEGLDNIDIAGESYAGQGVIDIGSFDGHCGFLIAHNGLMSDSDRDSTESFLIQEI